MAERLLASLPKDYLVSIHATACSDRQRLDNRGYPGTPQHTSLQGRVNKT